jgi:integrase
VLGDERLRELDLPRLQRFVDRLAADGMTAATITTVITPLRAIYKRARQMGEVKNPITGVSVPSVLRRQERFATTEQVEALMARLDTVKDRALWATAIYAGLRRGELRALRREDVDLATEPGVVPRTHRSGLETTNAGRFSSRPPAAWPAARRFARGRCRSPRSPSPQTSAAGRDLVRPGPRAGAPL